MAVRQRRKVADYLNVGTNGKETYEFMGLGFSELNESPGAQTSKKRYINDKSASTSITGYEPEFSFETDQIRSEKAIDYICEIGELQKIGDEAQTSYIKVDLDKPGKEENTYRARKFNVAIEVSDFDEKDGEMSAKGKFLQVGDLEVGTFNTTTKTYTKGFDITE